MNYISVPLNFLPELVIFESELNNMIHQFETIIGNKIRDLFNEERIRQNENPIEALTPRQFIPYVARLILKDVNPNTQITENVVIERLQLTTLDDIVETICNHYFQYEFCRCNLFRICNRMLSPFEVNRTILLEVLKSRCIHSFISPPSCEMIEKSYLFYLQERRVGTTEEIIHFAQLMDELEEDPEEFHEKYKLKTPTPNLSALQSQSMTNEIQEPMCGICQDQIEIEQQYYKLPCCHLFHATDNECLGNSTIMCWLRENKVCPICKQEIVLK